MKFGFTGFSRLLHTIFSRPGRDWCASDHLRLPDFADSFEPPSHSYPPPTARWGVGNALCICLAMVRELGFTAFQGLHTPDLLAPQCQASLVRTSLTMSRLPEKVTRPSRHRIPILSRQCAADWYVMALCFAKRRWGLTSRLSTRVPRSTVRCAPKSGVHSNLSAGVLGGGS